MVPEYRSPFELETALKFLVNLRRFGASEPPAEIPSEAGGFPDFGFSGAEVEGI